MPVSYMGRTQAQVVTWAGQFTAQAIANAAAFNIPTAMATQLTTLNSNLQEAWVAYANPANRTRGVTKTKNDALRDFKAFVKNVVNTIQAAPGVTDAQRLDLGITVRKAKPSKDPVPATQPKVTKKKTVNRTVTLGITQEDNRRGKPAKTLGANVYILRDAASPTAPGARWELLFLTGKNPVDVPLGFSATGTTEWFAASWVNGSKESGPMSDPISVNVAAGGAAPIATADADDEGLRLAA